MPASRTPRSPNTHTLDRIQRQRQVDRSAWAGEAREIITWETNGSGRTSSPLIVFSNVFEREPFFSYAIEMAQGQGLNADDLPVCTAGIASWTSVELPQGGFMYTGATVFVSIQTVNTPYNIVWRFSFEGIVMRSKQHIGAG